MTQNMHESAERAIRYAKHVTELAAAFGVRLIVLRDAAPHEAAAGTIVKKGRQVHHSKRERCVSITPVIDETTYAVALHELGHCLHPAGMVNQTHGSVTMRKTNQIATLSDMRLQLLEEESAWEWAHHYALEWTEVMSQVERLALSTYRRKARQLGLKEL